MRRGVRERGSFEMSSLDVFCCGFAGAVLLFLVLSVVKDSPSMPALPTKYAIGRWEFSPGGAIRIQVIESEASNGSEVTMYSLCPVSNPGPCTYKTESGQAEFIEELALTMRSWESTDGGRSNFTLLLGIPDDATFDDFSILVRCDGCRSGASLSGWLDVDGRICVIEQAFVNSGDRTRFIPLPEGCESV